MAWVAAITFLSLIAVNWGMFILAFSPFMLMAWLYNLKTTPRVNWLKGVSLVQDLAVNVILGGDHRTYISSLLGHLKSTKSEGGTIAANFVDWIWLIVFKEENHCIKAMKPTDKYDWSASRALLGTSVFWLNIYLIFKGIQWLLS